MSIEHAIFSKLASKYQNKCFSEVIFNRTCKFTFDWGSAEDIFSLLVVRSKPSVSVFSSFLVVRGKSFVTY